MKLKLSPARILDFDIENRPLSYLGSDFTTAEVTAIATGWLPPKGWRVPEIINCNTLQPDGSGMRFMLEWFRKLYDKADIVTGHYIRKHDLPIINGALLEQNMPPLKPKLTIDTKLDLLPVSGISKSQESLGDILSTSESKYHMTQADWRLANRLTPEGISLARARVMADVRQHMQMYRKLADLGYLRSPKLWAP